jgi:hypothetical protein
MLIDGFASVKWVGLKGINDMKLTVRANASKFV